MMVDVVNLKQIEAFRAVMQTGTVTAAAERLHISQPAVSRLLALLESKLKFKLFIRSKQRLHPTPEAVLLAREVELSFVGLEKLERAAKSIGNAATGSLRIASIPLLGVVFLPRVVARFCRSHPGVSISLQTRSSTTVAEWVASSNFDLGFASVGVTQANVVSTIFATLPGVCILPAGHRLAAQETVEAGDLEGEEFISFDPADNNRAAVDKVFRDADLRRRLNIEAPYAAVIAGLVAEGVGVSVVNPIAVIGHPSKLLAIRPFQPAIEFGFALIYRRDIPLSLVARAFLADLRTEFIETFGREGLRSP